MPSEHVRSQLIDLRQSLKSARDALSEDQRDLAEKETTRHFLHWKRLPSFQNIACYYSVQGEFPTKQLIKQLFNRNIQVYLPILNVAGGNSLNFQKITDTKNFGRNRFGIPEPVPDRKKQIDAKQLDLVIVPLTGFDQEGNRLGMGGGFYDRTFAFTKNHHFPSKPYLLGLAFDIQLVEKLNSQSWDIPLNAILTESGLVEFP